MVANKFHFVDLQTNRDKIQFYILWTGKYAQKFKINLKGLTVHIWNTKRQKKRGEKVFEFWVRRVCKQDPNPVNQLQV